MSIRNNKIASAIMEFSNGRNVPMHPYMNLPISNEDVLDETHGTATIIMSDMRQESFDKYGVRVDVLHRRVLFFVCSNDLRKEIAKRRQIQMLTFLFHACGLIGKYAF